MTRRWFWCALAFAVGTIAYPAIVLGSVALDAFRAYYNGWYVQWQIPSPALLGVSFLLSSFVSGLVMAGLTAAVLTWRARKSRVSGRHETT